MTPNVGHGEALTEREGQHAKLVAAKADLPWGKSSAAAEANRTRTGRIRPIDEEPNRR